MKKSISLTLTDEEIMGHADIKRPRSTLRST